MKTIKELDENDIKAAIAAHLGARPSDVVLTITPPYDFGPTDSAPATVAASVTVDMPTRPAMDADEYFGKPLAVLTSGRERCQIELMNAGCAYPRSCPTCGLAGPCRFGLTQTR